MPYTIKRAADVTEYYPYLLPGRHCFTDMMVPECPTQVKTQLHIHAGLSWTPGHPNRAPLWSDQVFPNWPTYPSDTLLRAAPAHLRTLTDIHYNFLYINLQHTSRSPHGAFLIHTKTQISSILRLDDVTTNITFYQLISSTPVSSKNAA